MKSKSLIIAAAAILVLAGSFMLFRKFSSPGQADVKPTPTPEVTAEQLPAEKQPKVSLTFTSDGHFATINLKNLNAASLEYNLIYDAVVKKNQIQTGVTGSAKVEGISDYSNKQLLGSESSGKFTYHDNISNAVVELTLRNSIGYSIFSATYPFKVAPGKTVDLAVSE